jgi:putative restriction endonuclease
MSNFPGTVVPDVLEAVGLDAQEVLGVSDLLRWPGAGRGERRRDPGWWLAVLEAWDRQCAFCGYDGQFAGASVGIEAAHVRWFAFDGPGSPRQWPGLVLVASQAVRAGVVGLSNGLTVMVSARFSARTLVGRAAYDLHGPSRSSASTAIAAPSTFAGFVVA